MLTKQGNKMTKNEFVSKRIKNNGQLLIDEIDMKILKILSKGSRISNREIARMMGLSVNTVISRIGNLEATNVIKGYRAAIDFEKLGYGVTAIIGVVLNKNIIKEIEKEIAKSPNVCIVYDVTGRFDAVLIAKFKNTNELSDFVKSIYRKGFIESTETSVVLNNMKEDFSLP